MKTRENGKKKTQYITIEDEEGMEDWPLPAIVPVVFSERRGKIEAECYFGVYDAVRRYLDEYADRLFSRDSLAALDRALAPYLQKQGYVRGGGIYRYYRSFVLWKEDELRTDGIRGDSRLLDAALLRAVKRNRTGFDLRELLKKKLPAAVTLIDGEAVSIATVNEHSPGQRLLEAAVYTRPEQRGKGFGKSNTALLCRFLLQKKKGVVYCCSCRNRASLAIARELGFRKESRFYAVDAYLTDKNEGE